jgi:hypothetical protein
MFASIPGLLADAGGSLLLDERALFNRVNAALEGLEWFTASDERS